MNFLLLEVGTISNATKLNISGQVCVFCGRAGNIWMSNKIKISTIDKQNIYFTNIFSWTILAK